MQISILSVALQGESMGKDGRPYIKGCMLRVACTEDEHEENSSQDRGEYGEPHSDFELFSVAFVDGRNLIFLL